ncbi:hypothetical protein Tco_0131002, partial [Tanacetum coccineum]
ALGRKRGVMISGGQSVARLAKHFGLLTEQRLHGLTVIVRDLPMIDIVELVTDGALDIDEGAKAIPAPVHAPLPPPAVAHGRTMSQRLARLEEDVHGLQGGLGE